MSQPLVLYWPVNKQAWSLVLIYNITVQNLIFVIIFFYFFKFLQWLSISHPFLWFKIKCQFFIFQFSTTDLWFQLSFFSRKTTKLEAQLLYIQLSLPTWDRIPTIVKRYTCMCRAAPKSWPEFHLYFLYCTKYSFNHRSIH